MKQLTDVQGLIIGVVSALVAVLATVAIIVGVYGAKTQIGSCYKNRVMENTYAKITQRIEWPEQMNVYYTVLSESRFDREDPEKAEYGRGREEESFLELYDKVSCDDYEKSLQKVEVEILQRQIFQLKLRGDR